MRRFLVIVGVVSAMVMFSAGLRILNAPWGWLYVDGTPFFESPTEIDLDPGSHEILLIRHDMVPLESTVNVGKSDKEIRLVLKPLKGWVKKTAVMVLEEDLKDPFVKAEENVVAEKLVEILREYNVPADLIRLYPESIYDPHVGMVIIDDVLSHPWRYPYIVVMYVLRIMSSVFDEYDYLVAGTFSSIHDSLSGDVSGTLELVLYDLKDMDIVPKPEPYSSHELYPGFSEKFFEGEEEVPNFFTLRWEVGGKGMDLETVAEKDIMGILPYLIDMLAADSGEKGVDFEVLKEENPEIDWATFEWLMKKTEAVGR